MGTVKEHQTTIDGITYRTKTLPAAEGLDLLPKLVGLIGKDTLAVIMGAADPEALLADSQKTAAIVMSAAERASSMPEGLSGIVKALLRYTAANKVRIGDAEIPGNVADNFDTHFTGRLPHLLEVVTWVARVVFVAP